ncbi:MAG: 3-deoxy-D-manno-octulosonic acid transferase [Pseudomonadales bacterium]|nr:3-deoxy-D-manno-octulosonic acid transferase [Pseudomonadales bacterium]
MMRFLYSLFLYLSVPLILLRLYLRGKQSPGYRQRIAERFGRFNPAEEYDQTQTTIWIHAVSVGETVAAEPLVNAIKQAYPDAQILFTSMTPTGSERAQALFGNSVFRSYLPYDLPTAVSRFLNTVNPDLLIIMETELWPNLIHQCHSRGVKTILANARLSKNSAAGYARIGRTTRTMLQGLNAIAVQSKQDAKRIEALGADPNNISITGSLKFNVEQTMTTERRDPYFSSIKASGRTIIVAASTREGEEVRVLTAFKKVLEKKPQALLLLVPRHPERFDEVTKQSKKLELNTLRRSEQTPVTESTQVIVGDSMGEMASYYSISDIAFVGGSLVDTGCQNVLEPAALALPVVVGPSQYNFAQICKQLEFVGGLKTVIDVKGLANSLEELIDSENKRQQMGAAARSVIDDNQQALPNLMKVINEVFSC